MLKENQPANSRGEQVVPQSRSLNKPEVCGAWVDIQFEVRALPFHSGAFVRGLTGCDECPMWPTKRVSGRDPRSIGAAEEKLFRSVEEKLPEFCGKISTNPSAKGCLDR